MTTPISFGSDNHSGVHPNILAAIEKANHGHHPAYGSDPLTREARRLFKETFGPEAETFFVFNGTAANTLAVRTLCQSYEAVLVSETAHLYIDECGAPEFIGGNKLISWPTMQSNGKLDTDFIHDLETREINPANPHRVLPRLVSLTQATELGTTYSQEELAKLCEVAHRRGLLVHMDGARLANAAAFLGCELRQITTDVGVDALSFGGTKNGLLCAEALVFLRPGLSEGFDFMRKQSMQLASKMRYLSCQFIPYLGDELWKKNAQNANRAAQYLRQKLLDFPGVECPFPTEANEVFIRGPGPFESSLIKHAGAFRWDGGPLRLVCSFDITTQDVDSMMAKVSSAYQKMDP